MALCNMGIRFFFSSHSEIHFLQNRCVHAESGLGFAMGLWSSVISSKQIAHSSASQSLIESDLVGAGAPTVAFPKKISGCGPDEPSELASAGNGSSKTIGAPPFVCVRGDGAGPGCAFRLRPRGRLQPERKLKTLKASAAVPNNSISMAVATALRNGNDRVIVLLFVSFYSFRGNRFFSTASAMLLFLL